MEANLNKLLATVDRVFKIELMKMPHSLHTTLIKDLMNGTRVTYTACLSCLDIIINVICLYNLCCWFFLRWWHVCGRGHNGTKGKMILLPSAVCLKLLVVYFLFLLFFRVRLQKFGNPYLESQAKKVQGNV